MEDLPSIAIARTFEGVELATQRVLARLGGMAAILDGAEIALLKPNLVAGRASATGATTSFDLLAAVAAEVRTCGAEPLLCEIPGTEFDREATYRLLGLEEFCARQSIRIVRIDPEGGTPDWIELRPAGAQRLRRFQVPRLLQQACLINLPVLKTHVVSRMSLGMKNIMGLLPRPDRRAMHTLGIDRCIVDMNLGICPALTIVDGSVGQDGEGPLYGTAADLGVLVAGRQPLAVDLICCELVGVNPSQVPHLRLAQERLGRPAWTLVGQQPGVIKQFRLPAANPLYRCLFWLMYPLDYPYTWLAAPGQHLCTALYATGLLGTRPHLNAAMCTRCGTCVQACPLPQVIDLETLKIDARTCQRCLRCYEACPQGAIVVRGYYGGGRERR
ncbi:MAG TPA: DUF362 domain-containing protein [Ktedonobacteraceae bacterium]|jgi:uncharacterized protein (DUF362 family)/Pyruvate/2-oxoacid:ferredoxin oxidoreductase delta subunit